MATVDEFELVDEHASDGDPPDPPRGHRSGWSRPLPWLGAAVGLVLVGAVTAEPVVLLGTPGVELGISDLPLHEPPTMAWESSISSYRQIVAVTDERLVLLTDSGTSADVFGLDLATGGEVWRHHDPDHTCQQVLPITCVEEPGTEAAAIVTLAIGDGQATRVEHPGALGAIMAGENLVVVEEGEADIEDVVLLEPDGTERWRVQADAADTSSLEVWVWLSVAGDDLTLDLSGTTIDMPTGAVQERTTFTFSEDEWAELGSDGSITIHSAGGSATLASSEVATRFDDAVGGPVVLRQNEDGSLVAALRDTDEELWERTEDSCSPEARLQHVVVLTCWTTMGGQRLLGVDELTGDELWKHDMSVWTAAASHDTILMIDQVDGHLLALDPTDGTIRWQLETPTAFGITPDGAGGLLTSGRGGIRRLVWD